MAGLGDFKVDDTLTFVANTHDPTDGSATDADAVPAYRVYEDETGTAILTGNMAKLDDANTIGFYSEQLTLSAANGFEAGRSYTIYISAVVGGTTGTTSHQFTVDILGLTDTQSKIDELHGRSVSIKGTISDISPSAIEFDTDLTSADGAWDDHVIVFVSGNLDGQSAPIASYVQANGHITIDPVEAFTAAPDNGSNFIIGSDHVHPVSQIADAVFDEPLAEHSGAGTVGKAISDTLQDTSTTLPNQISGSGSGSCPCPCPGDQMRHPELL